MKTHNYTPRSLPIGSVSTHPELQKREAGTDNRLVNQYVRGIEKGDSFPPIKLARIGKKHYILDGHHRLEAHHKAGVETIEALVGRMSLPEAKREALLSNATNGKPLSQKDKKAIFKTYLEEGYHQDDWGLCRPARAIASDLGNIYSFQHVSRLLREYGIAAPRDDIMPWSRDDNLGLEDYQEDMEDLEESEQAHLDTFKEAIQSAEDAFAILESDKARHEAAELVSALSNTLQGLVNPRVSSLDI